VNETPGKFVAFSFFTPGALRAGPKKCTSAQGAAVSLGKLHRDQRAVLQADHRARIEVQFFKLTTTPASKCSFQRDHRTRIKVQFSS
jgi:hypothetical protein